VKRKSQEIDGWWMRSDREVVRKMTGVRSAPGEGKSPAPVELESELHKRGLAG